MRAFGHSNSTALTISASLAQVGEFSFILAALGISLGLLPEEGRDLILAGAIISILANPVLFDLLQRWKGIEREDIAKDTPAAAEGIAPASSPATPSSSATAASAASRARG